MQGCVHEWKCHVIHMKKKTHWNTSHVWQSWKPVCEKDMYVWTEMKQRNHNTTKTFWGERQSSNRRDFSEVIWAGIIHALIQMAGGCVLCPKMGLTRLNLPRESERENRWPAWLRIQTLSSKNWFSHEKNANVVTGQVKMGSISNPAAQRCTGPQPVSSPHSFCRAGNCLSN